MARTEKEERMENQSPDPGFARCRYFLQILSMEEIALSTVDSKRTKRNTLSDRAACAAVPLLGRDGESIQKCLENRRMPVKGKKEKRKPFLK